jgi:probable O-glycosylation ligase (exosortase A-associated)
MRDLFVTAIVFGSVPFILWRPWIGIIVWCWLSYMNPHKQAWGFATTMPFAFVVAIATLVGILFMREPKRIPWTRESITLVLLLVWVFITTLFAMNPDGAWPQLDKVAKIQLMTFATLMLITSEQRLKVLVWMIALSLGYYGVKGGIFTISRGGAHHVLGPAGTFIEGNNEIGLALVIVIPLMRFLQLDAKRWWIRWGVGGAMLLSAIAAIGTQSRGAFLALAAMGIFLWLKSRNKLVTGVLAALAVAAVLAIMPPQYYERLATIQTYEQDGSAMGRINAWWFAWNLANERPLVGGGFEVFRPWFFKIYAPQPDNYHDVHSIYFEMLGEHGFVGLALFLLLFLFTWRSAAAIIRRTRKDAEIKWMSDLAAMVQVSLVGYAMGGAFLGLAYFDLPYHLVAIVIILTSLLEQRKSAPVAQPAPGLASGPVPVANTRAGPALMRVRRRGP